MNHSRRWALRYALLLPGALAGTLPAFAGSCVTDDDESSSLRSSLKYSDSSPDPAKACAACAFFTAGDASCGNCQILHASANAEGHCDSWAAKG